MKPGDWLKQVQPSWDVFYPKYLESVPIIDGMPFFTGTSESFHCLAKFWTGEIEINGEKYPIRFHPRRWTVIDQDKRNLPDEALIVFMRLHKEYLEAYNQEKILRKAKAVERLSEYNANHWKKNKDKITLRQKETKRMMKIQHEIQLKEIYQMIVEGKTKQEIGEYLTDKYKYTQRRINQLLEISSKRLKEEVSYDKDQLRDKHHGMLIELYKKNLDKGDFKECRLILETIQKVYGLNQIEPTKVEVEKVIRFKFDNTPPNRQIENQDIEFAQHELVLDEAKEEFDSIKQEEEKIMELKKNRENEEQNGKEENK